MGQFYIGSDSELYRHGAEWKFKAVGQGFAGGLAALASQHGVNI